MQYEMMAWMILYLLRPCAHNHLRAGLICLSRFFLYNIDKDGIRALLFGLSAENLSRNSAESGQREFAGSSVGHWCNIADL